MDCPNWEVVLERERYVGVNAPLCVFLGAGCTCFVNVLYAILPLKLCDCRYIRLGTWGGHRLGRGVPHAFSHFVEERLIEHAVRKFTIEGCTTGIGFHPIIKAPGCHLLMDPLRFELNFWGVGNYSIDFTWGTLGELRNNGDPISSFNRYNISWSVTFTIALGLLANLKRHARLSEHAKSRLQVLQL